MSNSGKLLLEYKKAYRAYLENRNQYNAGKIDGMSSVMLGTGFFVQSQLTDIQQDAALEYYSE